MTQGASLRTWGVPDDARRALGRFRGLALIAGVAGLALGVVGWFVEPAAFFRGYLLAYLFWAGIAIGCLAFMLVHQLSGGAWGRVMGPALEAAALTLPLLALLFIPVLLGLDWIYVWTDLERFAPPSGALAPAIHHLEHKTIYLNVWGLWPPGFLARAVVYFLLWSALSLLVVTWRRRQDEAPRPGRASALHAVSGAGLLLLVITGTFMAIDWIMSLDPLWYSTIFPFYVLTGFGTAGIAFAILVTMWLGRRAARDLPASSAFPGEAPFAAAGRSTVLNQVLVHDMGKWLFVMVNFYAYIAFSQYLIIWSGNLPEEVGWFLVRRRGAWGALPVLLVALHWVLPFFVLLSRHTKRREAVVMVVAALLLLMRMVDLSWLVVPAWQVFPDGALEHVSLWRAVEGVPRVGAAWLWCMAAASLLGIGGVWLAAFAWRLAAPRPLIVIPLPGHAASAAGARRPATEVG